MKLTDNWTVLKKIWAGACDWGCTYLEHHHKKGWIDNAWVSGSLGNDKLFNQILLN